MLQEIPDMNVHFKTFRSTLRRHLIRELGDIVTLFSSVQFVTL